MSRHLLNVHKIDIRPGRGKPGQKRKREDDAAPAHHRSKLQRREGQEGQVQEAPLTRPFNNLMSVDTAVGTAMDATTVRFSTPNGMIAVSPGYNLTNAVLTGSEEELRHPLQANQLGNTSLYHSSTDSGANQSLDLPLLDVQHEEQALRDRDALSQLSNSAHDSDEASMDYGSFQPTAQESEFDNLDADWLFHGFGQDEIFQENIAHTAAEPDGCIASFPSDRDEKYMIVDDDARKWLNEVESVFGSYGKPLMAEADDILSRL